MKTYATAFDDGPCPKCRGAGYIKHPNFILPPCPSCKGTGKRTKIVHWGTCRHCLWMKLLGEVNGVCKHPRRFMLPLFQWDKNEDCPDYHFVREERRWEPDDVPEWAWIVQCGEDQWQSETCGSCGWCSWLSLERAECTREPMGDVIPSQSACREWKPRTDAVSILKRRYITTEEREQSLRDERKYDEGYRKGLETARNTFLELFNNQQDLEPDIVDLVDKHFWDLVDK